MMFGMSEAVQVVKKKSNKKVTRILRNGNL